MDDTKRASLKAKLATGALGTPEQRVAASLEVIAETLLDLEDEVRRIRQQVGKTK